MYYFHHYNREQKIWIILFQYTLIMIGCICSFGGIYNLSMKKDFYFVEQDPNLSYPKVTAQVSSSMLGFICGGIPIILLFSLGLFHYFTSLPEKRRKIMLLLGYYLVGTYLSLFATMLCTEIMKITTGEPRPNFYHYCNYQYINDNMTYYLTHTTFGQEGDYQNCKGNGSDNKDARASFPSGHSSYTMASALSIMIFLYFSKLHSPLSYFPLILAFYVAVSRIQDYFHHTYDVIGGMLIGTLITIMVWSHLYPTLKLVLIDALGNDNDDEDELKGKGSQELHSVTPSNKV